MSQLQSPHCGWDRQTTIIQCPSPSPSLGLDFCPSPRINIPKKSWDKLVHNCKNSYHHTVVGSRRTFLLRNKRKTIIKSTAKVPDPPIKVTQDLQAAKDRLEALKIPPTNNITPHLRRALHDLKTDHSIVINKADKGSSITILNKIDYIQEGLLHLNDQATYEPLEKDTTLLIQAKSNVIFRNATKRNWITQELAEACRRNPDEVKTQYMYFLTKIHKTPTQVRPIVSGRGGPTEMASALLDNILQPYVNNSPQILNNSIALIRKNPRGHTHPQRGHPIHCRRQEPIYGHPPNGSHPPNTNKTLQQTIT